MQINTSYNDIYTNIYGDVFKTPVYKNIKVFNSGLVMAGFYAGDIDPNSIYHAFGEGLSGWDLSPVNPEWDEETLTTEFYRTTPDSLPQYIKYGIGIADSGSTTEIFDPRRLDSGFVRGRTEPDGFFVGQTIEITSGTNLGETRTIVSYTRSTGRIEVDTAFPVAIDVSSEYEIQPVFSVSPTNTIEIRTTLPMGLVTDPFNGKNYREHAFFLGTDSDQPNMGLMINKLHHPLRYKDETITVERFAKLTFIV